MRMKCLAIILAVSFSILSWEVLQAAELTVVGPSNKLCWMKLDGEIRKGDLAKIKRIIGDESYGKDSICLNSVGGSWEEGLKIAGYFLKQHVRTVINKNATCYSACAIAFMAGNFAYECDVGVLTHRMLHVRGKLGFHAPFLKVRQGKYNKQTVENAYNAAILAVAQFSDMARELGVNHSLVTDMLKKGSSQLLFIDTLDKAGRWNISLFGYKLPKKLEKAQVINACMNNFIWWGKNGFDVLEALKRRSNSSSEYYRKYYNQSWGEAYSERSFIKKSSKEYRVSRFGYSEWQADCKITIVRSEYAPSLIEFLAGGTDGIGSRTFNYWSAFKPTTKINRIPEGNMHDIIEGC